MSESGPSESPLPIKPSISQSTPYSTPLRLLTVRYIAPSESPVQVMFITESWTIGPFSLLIVITADPVHKLSSWTDTWYDPGPILLKVSSEPTPKFPDVKLSQL